MPNPRRRNPCRNVRTAAIPIPPGDTLPGLLLKRSATSSKGEGSRSQDYREYEYRTGTGSFHVRLHRAIRAR